jgi:hypothetical protein
VAFLYQSWFFTRELFLFMLLFYSVWLPGFLLAGLISRRYRHQAWNVALLRPELSVNALLRFIGLGITGSAGRKETTNALVELLNRGISPSLAFAFLIASRNMTIHFWAIFALSLGAEFATGQLLGALVMIGVVAVALRWLTIGPAIASVPTRSQGDVPRELPEFSSWPGLLFSVSGWKFVLKFIGLEVRRFGLSLIAGIILGGIILAGGYQSWWPVFADVFGHATLASDLVNAVVGAVLSPVFFLSPVGNLPVIHALFKTDGLGYPGIVSFCLASAIHPSDIKTYRNVFAPGRARAVVALLYLAAVLGGLGSTWIYDAFGFRPALPPVKLASKLARAVLEYLGF